MSTRRTFVKQLAAGSLATLAAPAIVAAAKTDAKRAIIGAGDHQYEANHHWPQLPDKYTWQTTHNVAVDSQGLVYVIHEGRLDQPDHPSIFVFDPDGKFVRAFGNEFQGGGHGLEVHREGSEDFLYVTAYQQQRSFAKLTLAGETVWRKFAPMQAGIFAPGEDVAPRAPDDNPWGRDRFHPTNYAFHPDGGFYLADGYGSFRIHRYDSDGNWQSMFGAPSDDADANGTFDTPHGIGIDNRPTAGSAAEPLVLVADRANARLQWFTLAGEHRRTQDGFLLPANADVRGELLLIPDLIGRVTLLDGQNNVIAHLGDDSERIKADTPDGVAKTNWSIRGDESTWRPGKFIHPHDACFDSDGNIFVAEWVERGRITKLRKIT